MSVSEEVPLLSKDTGALDMFPSIVGWSCDCL